MRNKISYEWVFEEYDRFGDIVDPLFSDTAAEAFNNELTDIHNTFGVALVRNEGNDIDGLRIREYAYVKGLVLPNEFDDGYTIPQRFHKELQGALK